MTNFILYLIYKKLLCWVDTIDNVCFLKKDIGLSIVEAIRVVKNNPLDR